MLTYKAWDITTALLVQVIIHALIPYRGSLSNVTWSHLLSMSGCPVAWSTICKPYLYPIVSSSLLGCSYDSAGIDYPLHGKAKIKYSVVCTVLKYCFLIPCGEAMTIPPKSTSSMGYLLLWAPVQLLDYYSVLRLCLLHHCMPLYESWTKSIFIAGRNLGFGDPDLSRFFLAQMSTRDIHRLGWNPAQLY
jgi:hypothetical protein